MALSFRQRLKKGNPLLGTIQTLPALEITEILADARFDWLFIDMEHTALDVVAVQRILQVSKGRTAGIVRVPAGEEAWVKKALDAGTEGLIFPQVNTAAKAETVVRLCKYPPEGIRSVGLGRAHGYGMRFNEYYDGMQGTRSVYSGLTWQRTSILQTMTASQKVVNVPKDGHANQWVAL